MLKNRLVHEWEFNVLSFALMQKNSEAGRPCGCGATAHERTVFTAHWQAFAL